MSQQGTAGEEGAVIYVSGEHCMVNYAQMEADSAETEHLEGLLVKKQAEIEYLKSRVAYLEGALAYSTSPRPWYKAT
jgi:hypothetical protein